MLDNWSWTQLFFLNWFVNIVVIEILAIRKLERVAIIDEARDSKYPAFRRYDTFWYSRWWLYPTCHLMLAKFLFVFFCIFLCVVTSNTLAIGLGPNDAVRGIRYFLIRCIFWCTSRVVIAGMGTYWQSTERPEVDYKPYLGPDWVPDYDKDRTATVVCNHSAFADSMLHGMVQMPSIIAKFEVQNVPGVGPIARVA